ncbi:MAG: M20/M25/M40 family metallo-hydrolase [Chloroflexota bacterium]
MNKWVLMAAIAFSTVGAAAAPSPEQDFVQEHSETVNRIIKAARADTLGFSRLEYMCDMFGPRLCGSEGLERALDWIYAEMKADKFDDVKSEPVMVPHWVRGEESLEMTYPRAARLNVLGLGGTIATPPEGITAQVLVVKDFDELRAAGDRARGKIVVYNEPFKSYGQAVQYRFGGAVEAAKAGAVASLARSVTPHSHETPHTGVMFYDDTVKKIPHASITGEAADLLTRMQARGVTPTLTLKLGAQTLPDAESRNVYCELRGRELPDEIIAGGGHTDSWDVGTGAHDDASGVLAVWDAVRLLKDLGIKPKRTIRAVGWVNEENGTRGGKDYADKHKNEKHVLLFEFDSGCFAPETIGFSGPEALTDYVKGFEPLLARIGDVKTSNHGGGVDIGPMVRQGNVPAMSLSPRDEGKYFWYHHSAADTPEKINPEDYRNCVAAIAVALYLYSEYPEEIKGNK